MLNKLDYTVVDNGLQFTCQIDHLKVNVDQVFFMNEDT